LFPAIDKFYLAFFIYEGQFTALNRVW